MNPLERALAAIAAFLETHRVPYMVIGGIANLVWGEPRSTLDVDASVAVEEADWPALIEELRKTFRVMPKHPLVFLRDTHVLPVETADGIRIDLVWARLPYEHKAIARAWVEEVAHQRVRVCRPEDLIIHKIVSDRLKDREDIRGIIRHQGTRLQRQYLMRAVEELSRALDQPELLTFLNDCFPSRPTSEARPHPEVGEADIDGLRQAAQEAPVIRLVDLIIREAIKEHAGEIHIEPSDDGVRVRLRRDREFLELSPPARQLLAPIVDRLKLLAKLTLTEHGRRQEGTFAMLFGGREIRFRVCTEPSPGGEKILVTLTP